ncbi:dscam:-like isoform D [Dinothrombium tinctorium]|uniref:Dscam:-like isoform D n=1 Tax=Dinothrombium tinctorium TaxID=1965070 RepID=A0A3S3PE20_9ACAR|nr:dscam:-like isoform D [Dinothrombium tinctorium]
MDACLLVPGASSDKNSSKAASDIILLSFGQKPIDFLILLPINLLKPVICFTNLEFDSAKEQVEISNSPAEADCDYNEDKLNDVWRTSAILPEQSEVKRPVFIIEPPNRVDFLNSTGVSIDCKAIGNPSPKISWKLRRDINNLATNVPNLRETLANGTLVLKPMKPEQYRQDVHASVYNCEASNTVGTILSRDIRVTGVINQFYEIQVYDEFVLVGNTAVLRCHIPSFLKDYLFVTSWLKDETRTIKSTASEGGRYSVFASGELHIRNATQEDSSPSYRCQMTHKLTKETRVSVSGRLIVTDSSGTVPPRVTHSPPPIVIKSDASVEVPCAAQGYPIPQYIWYRVHNTSFAQLDASRASQLSGSLILRRVNIYDSGKYLCVVRNSAGEERVETTITVTASLRVIVEPSVIIVKVGQSASFLCNISGNPVNSILWYKDGKALNFFSDSRLFTEANLTVLRIGSVSLEDGGLYQCFVSNDFESAQSVAQLNLGGDSLSLFYSLEDTIPSFYDVFPEMTVESNNPVSLKCSASGNPVPQIKWKLDGIPISSDESSRFGFTLADFVREETNSVVVSFLNISAVRVEDGGLYECEANNGIGSIVHSKRLNVYGKPFIRPMPDVKAVAGRALVVRCPYSGYPIEHLSWLKDSKRLPVNRRQDVFPNGTLVISEVQKQDDDGTYTCLATNKGHTASGTVKVSVMDPTTYNLGIRTDEFSSDLSFQRVSTRHNGNYTCIVSNDVASVSHSATLLVDVAPYWKVEPSDAAVVAGSSVMIDCLAEGFPPPITTWERGSSIVPRHFIPIASGPHFEVYANGSLLVKSVENSDAGYYLCQTNNGIGPGLSKVVTLHVHAPPRFTNTFQSETVRAGEKIKLKCEAIGDNPMTIDWQIDKQPLNVVDDGRFERNDETDEKRLISILTVETAQRRDSALYTCFVSNVYGKGEMNIRLIVQEPPEPPKQLKLIEHRSRIAKLSWHPSFNGNSPITKYWITCHPKDFLSKPKKHFNKSSSPISLIAKKLPFGHINVSIDTISINDGTNAIIRGLRPATKFLCTAKAENEVGVSDQSEHIEFTTDEEAPEGPPLEIKAEALDSRSIKIFWKHPEPALWNGKLKGYYIGYKISETSDQYLYKTLETVEGQETNEVVITGLIPFTSYNILIQAYNSMGAGPRSDELTVTTLEDVPDAGPSYVQCTTINSQEVAVVWNELPPESIRGILQGFRVVFRPLGADISQVRERVVEVVHDVKLANLLKYTNYSIEVVPFTRKGNGVSSKPVYCRTAEDVPASPSQIKAIVVSSDSVIVTWKDPLFKNGIITKYTVYWKELNNNRTKTSVSVPKSRNNLFSTRYRWLDPAPQYKLTGLREHTPYEVWVTASTRVGEGQPSSIVSAIPSKNVAAQIIEWNETVMVSPGESSPIVIGCHCVGTEPIEKTWFKNGEKVTTIEPDGSLLLDTMPDEPTNYTCTAVNQFGSDSVMYYLIKANSRIEVKIVSTSFSSCQIFFSNELGDNQSIVKDYELYYRVSGSDIHEWQIKPIFKVMDVNHSVILDNLLCGTPYQLYVTELQTGIKSDTVTFRTQGSAPVAPKKEEILKVVNDSSILVYSNAWDQSLGCPITKLVIEYRSSNYHTWRTVSTQAYSEKSAPVVISNVKPKTLYSIRITAHTKGAPSTMAEYEVKVGFDEADTYLQGSGDQRGLVIDTTTLVSLASSLIVLISGFIAVICLFVYRKKSTKLSKNRSGKYRRQSSASCAPSSQTDDSSERRGPVRSDSSSGVASKSQLLASVQSISEKPTQRKPIAKLQPLRTSAKDSALTHSPVRGKLPTVHIPTKQLEEIEKEIQNEYDEITPYATFRLTGDEDATTEEEFKTFSVTIGEPAYMYKGSMDGAPTTSRDYKMCLESRDQHPYVYGGINSHSLTSGSSNQDELMRAYEYGRRYNHLKHSDPGIRQFTKSPPRPNEQRQGICFTLGGGGTDNANNSSSSSSTTSTEEESSSSVTPVNEPRVVPVFNVLSRDRSRRPSWTQSTISEKMSHSSLISSQGTNIKIGLSSDDEEDSNRSYQHKREQKRGLHRQRKSPRLRVKRPPYRTKSKSDEIEC